MTGMDWITAALKSINAIGVGETPSDDEAADALATGNDWINALATERLTIYYVLRTTKTLTASTVSYSIGTGGDIAIVRPESIEALGLVLDINATIPVEISIPLLTDQEWQRLPMKSLTSTQPAGAYYDHNWIAGLGRIYPVPIPTVSTTQLVIYSPQALTEFADLTTDYTFPPGYRRFLRTGLAMELAPEWSKTLDPVLVQQAIDAKADIKRANHRLAEMGMDPALAGRGGVYNIFSDTNGSSR